MRLFRALITGGELTDLEEALGNCFRVFRRRALADVTSARHRSTFVSLGLHEHPLNQIQVRGKRWSQLRSSSVRLGGPTMGDWKSRFEGYAMHRSTGRKRNKFW